MVIVVLVTVLTVIIGFQVLAGQVPGFINSSKNITTAILGADWGDSTVNGLNSPMALLTALGSMFALVATVFYVLSKGTGSES